MHPESAAGLHFALHHPDKFLAFFGSDGDTLHWRPSLWWLDGCGVFTMPQGTVACSIILCTYLARAESGRLARPTLRRAQGRWRDRTRAGQGTRQRKGERRRRDGNGPYDAGRARRPVRRWTAPLVDPVSIHPSSYKDDSANFAVTEFYEVRQKAVINTAIE